MLQAVVLLTGRPESAFSQAALPSLESPREVAGWCQEAGLSVEASFHEVPAQATALGATVDAAMRAGAACVVRLRKRDATRWMLVTGTEAEQSLGGERVRSLLLLDSEDGGPWATGYNARLELLARARAAEPRSTEFGRRYRSIDGQRGVAYPHSLLVVRPASK